MPGASFTFAAVVTLAAALALWPLLLPRKCFLAPWTDDYVYVSHVSPRDFLLGQYRRPAILFRFGETIGFAAIISTLCTSLLRCSNRIDRKNSMCRMLLLYSGVLLVHFLIHAVFRPMVFAVCSPSSAILYSLLSSSTVLTYVAEQAILMYATLLRLMLVSSSSSVSQATMWLRLVGASGIVMIGLCVWLFLAGASPLIRTLMMADAAIVFSSYMAFQVASYRGLRASIQLAVAEAAESGHATLGTYYASRTAVSLLLSAISSIWYCASFLALDSMATGFPLSTFLYEASIVCDLGTDVALLLFSTGLLRPRGVWKSGSAELEAIGELVQQRRARLIKERLAATSRVSTGPAPAIAALLQGMDVEELLRLAAARFRCVCWSVLEHESHIVLSSPGRNVRSMALQLSDPCQLSHCDAFISHSWSDDPEAKWRALARYCEDFWKKQGRPPKLWFDKACVNQDSIESDLRCLPVFLAGCNTLAVFSGNTYPSRLWCALELFVYMTVAVADADRVPPKIFVLGNDAASCSKVVQSWLAFDVTACQCFQQRDKERILGVVCCHGAGYHGFNQYIKELAKQMLVHEATGVDDMVQVTSV